MNPIRILDADGGCDLVVDLVDVFRESNRCLDRFEIYGFISLEPDSGGLVLREKLLKSLAERNSGIDWSSRIRPLFLADPWPFDDRFFDFVLSSQALKPSCELGWYFEQQYRVLREFGMAIHYVPSGAKSVFGPLGTRLFAEFRSRVLKRQRTSSVRPCLETHSWRGLRRVAERVGFKVRPRYNGALLRRILSGEIMAYSYPRGSFDTSIAGVIGPWAPVTLAVEKHRLD